MTEKPGPFKSRPALWAGIIAGGAALATALVMALYANISERKAEARQISFKVVDLDERSIGPALWAKNFPRQFDGFQSAPRPRPHVDRPACDRAGHQSEADG